MLLVAGTSVAKYCRTKRITPATPIHRITTGAPFWKLSDRTVSINAHAITVIMVRNKSITEWLQTPILCGPANLGGRYHLG